MFREAQDGCAFNLDLPLLPCIRARMLAAGSGDRSSDGRAATQSTWAMDYRPSLEDLPRAQRLAEHALSTLHRFLHIDADSSGVLLIASAFALIWDNSAFAHSYLVSWNLPVTIGIGDLTFSRSLHFGSTMN